MKILTTWLREYLPALDISDRQLAEDLTLRGIAVEGVHALAGGGHLFEMDITTNRVDAMNHYGIAREAAAIYGVPLLGLEDERIFSAEGLPTAESEEAQSPRYGRAADGDAQEQAGGYPVAIDAADLCGRFTAQVIRGVTVGPSKGMVADRFAALGQKLILNAVDVTNHTWMAMGQPTHVFDLDTLEGGIRVRRAHSGEYLRLLDGSEKILTGDDLVIADAAKPLSLAGVMGGWDSRVTEGTRNVLVESAWFDPAVIRRSSRRHGLHTDASHRYERGADFAAAAVANRLVCKGVIAACGGEIDGPLTDVRVPALEARTAGRPRVRLSTDAVQRLLGTTIEGGSVSPDCIEQYLEALGCSLRPASDGGVYEVTLPSWRLDLEREIDLIEEVARVYGYNRFADTLPRFSGGVVALPSAAQETKAREVLLQTGWTEGLSNTFCSEAEAQAFDVAEAVLMGNPLHAEAAALRPTLLPGAVRMLERNLVRDVREVRLFELGTIFRGSNARVEEEPSLSLAAYGGASRTALSTDKDALLFETKGMLEDLLSRFAVGAIEFRPQALPAWIEQGRGGSIFLDGKLAGSFGELSLTLREQRKLREPVVLGELRLPLLFQYLLRQPLVKEPSRYQAVERDLSFVFADGVQWADVLSAVRELAIAEMTTLQPMEIFRDPKGRAIPVGEYSLLFRMTFQSHERTLNEEELATWQDAVISVLTRLGGKHRAPQAG